MKNYRQNSKEYAIQSNHCHSYHSLAYIPFGSTIVRLLVEAILNFWVIVCNVYNNIQFRQRSHPLLNEMPRDTFENFLNLNYRDDILRTIAGKFDSKNVAFMMRNTNSYGLRIVWECLLCVHKNRINDAVMFVLRFQCFVMQILTMQTKCVLCVLPMHGAVRWVLCCETVWIDWIFGNKHGASYKQKTLRTHTTYSLSYEKGMVIVDVDVDV